MLISLLALVLLIAGAVAAAQWPGLGPENGPVSAAAVAVVLAGLAFGALVRVALLAVVPLVRRRPVVVADRRTRIVVDGSNVMFWADETPRLATLTAVLEALIARDLAPVVYFDANVGYQLFDGFRGADAMGRVLPSGVAEVVVVGKGDPADPALIARALNDGARIISNDRFRDWRGQFPKVGEKGVLVGGEMAGGSVRLRM